MKVLFGIKVFFGILVFAFFLFCAVSGLAVIVDVICGIDDFYRLLGGLLLMAIGGWGLWLIHK